METSNFRPQVLHVAQQSRREKLRVQNNSDPSLQNAEEAVYTTGDDHLEHQFSGHEGGNGNLNSDLVQLRSSFRYGNLSYDHHHQPLVFPSDMINFGGGGASSNSQPFLLANGSSTKDVTMMHQESSVNNSSSGNKVIISGDTQNCSTWKSFGSQESCDWNIIGNNGYNTSGPASAPAAGGGGIDGNPSPIFVGGQGLSASLKSNSNHKLYGEYLSYHSPSIYHNPNVQQEMGFAAIHQLHSNSREASGVSWPNGAGNELVLLPAYADQSTNPVRGENACDSISRQVDGQCRRWNGDLVYSEQRKNADGDDLRRTANIDSSNAQALSLSLSSIPLRKSNGCESIGPQDFSNFNQDDMKTLKSEYLCFDGKASYNGKGIESDQHCMVGNPTLATSRNVGPLGPFTGYATILKSSRFLKPAQQLLDELCNMVGSKSMKFLDSPEKLSNNEIRASGGDDVNPTGSIVGALGGDSGGSSSTFYSSNNEKMQEVGVSSSSESYRPEYLQKKAKLLYMLEEVCRRYKHYNQQMQMVVSAFESVAGLSAATPYISLALKAVSRHFRCLRTAISDQLKNVRKDLGEDLSSPTTGTSGSNKLGDTSMTSRLKLMDQSMQKQHKSSGGGGSVGFFETQQNVWRPQRGLPERAVAILRAWLFDHFLHPYPTDADKHMLATQTGLSRNQVSNWFINARVRVWKPMVEEIHMLETKGSAETVSIPGTDEKTNATNVRHSNENQQQSNRLNTGAVFSEKQVECSEIESSEFIRNSRMNVDAWNQKRSRVECHVPGTMMDGSLVGFVPYQQTGIDIGSLGAVSLTLGLRRNSDGVQPQHHQFQQQQQHDNQLRRHFGDQMIYDFVG